MRIPFVIIVQSHLLRDKGSVRLRCVSIDGALDTTGSTTNEQIIDLENLAFTIKDLSAQMASLDEVSSPENHLVRDATSTGQTGQESRNQKASVDCIYVDHDQYYDPDRQVSKTETPNWKVVLKTMKSISQRGEQFIAGMMDPSLVEAGDSLPIFAVAHISFFALRDFGTCLMKRSRSERSAVGACREVAEEYPKFKRIIKTLGSAIESFMKRQGYWIASGHQSTGKNGHHHGSPSSGPVLVTVLLYSRADDRFDMLSLEAGSPRDEHVRHSRRK